MKVSLIVLLICLPIASFFTQKFKFKQEVSVTITFLSITLLLYLFGLFNLMKYCIYLIYLTAIFSTIYILYCFIQKKVKLSELITPSIIFYIFVILIATYIAKDTYYRGWDEFSHWGSNLKAMVTYDLFWSNKIYDGVHVVYTPLAGIAEYFFCKINGGFSETVSYYAINFFIISLLLPICKNEKYNLKSFIKLALFWLTIYCAIRLCKFSLSSIYIDLLLGILFASGMFLAFRFDGKDDKIALFLIMISLPLLKDSGLLLLGIILLTLFFTKVILKIIENKKVTIDNFKKLGILVLILIISLSLYGTWKIYCNINNRHLDDRHDKNSISSISITQYVNAILLLPPKDSKYYEIAYSFYNNLNDGIVLGTDNGIATTSKVFIVLNLIGILLYFIEPDNKIKKKILILLLCFDIGFILYCLMLLATYMFAFTEQEGRSLASYQRYISTYFIAWIIANLGIATNYKYSTKSIMLIFTCLLLCMFSINISRLIDINTRKEDITSSRKEIDDKAIVINSKVSLNEKVYLIYQNIDGGEKYHKLRYAISPRVTNLMYEWSLGPKYYNEDIWNYDITKEEFEQKLIDEEFDYVFIAKIDKQFMNIYGDLIDGYNMNNYQKLENKLLKVNKINANTIKLELVN